MMHVHEYRIVSIWHSVYFNYLTRNGIVILNNSSISLMFYINFRFTLHFSISHKAFSDNPAIKLSLSPLMLVVAQE